MEDRIIELEEKIFELEMELFRTNHSYECSNIIAEIEDNLLSCSTYYIKCLRDIVINCGYKKVEDWFINEKKKILKERQEYESKRDV